MPAHDERGIFRFLTGPHFPAVRSYEHEQFTAYCRSFRQQPEEIANQILRGCRSELEYILSRAGRNVSADAVELIRTLQAQQDLFVVKHAVSALHRRTYVSRIMDARADLRIDDSVVLDLAMRLDERMPKDANVQAAALATLLYGIPLVHIFDHRFNAFLHGESAIRGLPCICIYEALKDSTFEFIDLLLPVTLKDAESLALQDPFMFPLMCQNPMFIFGIRDCLGPLQGEPLDGVGPNRTAHMMRHAFRHHGSMTAGALAGVWYHEFGHLVLGHLRLAHSPELEFAADAFAFTLLSSDTPRYEDENLCRWIGFGVVFLLLAMREFLLQQAGGSHPPALVRLERMLAYAQATFSRPAYETLRTFLQRAVAACDPTLLQYAGQASRIAIPEP